MSLRGDQRALLQLLSERGQSYEDISDLLGKPAAEVRADARAALTEVGGSDPDAEVGLTDYLLGQADPIGRADATRHLQSSPEALELAKRIEAGLRLLAPEAKLPTLPEPRGKRARAALPAAGEDDQAAREARAEPSTGGGSGSRRPLIPILAAAGVILIAAILAIVLSRGDDSGSGDTATTAAAPSSKKQTVALEPVGGSGVGGTVTFSIVNVSNQPQPIADVELDGIPAPTDETAALMWIMVGDNAGFPLNTPLVPNKNGSVSGSIAIPADISSIFSGQVTAIRISSSNIKDVVDAAKQVGREGGALLPFTGKELAEGEISNG